VTYKPNGAAVKLAHLDASSETLAQKEIVVWGTAEGAADWEETILSTQCKTQADIDAIKARAAKEGFRNVRVSVLDLSTAPDFTKVLTA
jgi:hypothetical protein